MNEVDFIDMPSEKSPTNNTLVITDKSVTIRPKEDE